MKDKEGVKCLDCGVRLIQTEHVILGWSRFDKRKFLGYVCDDCCVDGKKKGKKNGS